MSSVLDQHDVLGQYTDPPFPYDFTQGPDVVRSHEDARRGGVNCISLAHLAMSDLFDIKLPPGLHRAEMYVDTMYFEDVADSDAMRCGDIVWFGIASPAIEPVDFIPVYENGVLLNWAAFPVKHATVFTGNRDHNGDPLLLHATRFAGMSTIWPMSKFPEYDMYRRRYATRRLIQLARV